MFHHHPASLSEDDLLAVCTLSRTRRSGPGGQHRNKVETAIVIEHRPTGIRAEASERRSQAENRQIAIFRLRLRLAVQVRLPSQETGPKAPSPLWQSRCRNGRIDVSSTHEDFPPLLAESLDVLEACEHDLQKTAQWLGISTSHFIRWLKKEPAAFSLVNDIRQKRGMHRLK